MDKNEFDDFFASKPIKFSEKWKSELGNRFLRLKEKNTRQYLVGSKSVSYTHLRTHETVLDLVCRLLLENKKNKLNPSHLITILHNTLFTPNNTELSHLTSYLL